MSMTSESEKDNTENVDEGINIDIVEQQTVKKVQFQVYHWTELKTFPYCCDREMIFPEDTEIGCVKPINCSLSSGKTGGGERAQVRYVQFDRNYLKYQIVCLLRDLLFSCSESEHYQGEIEVITSIFATAIGEFIAAKNDVIDNAQTVKAIKPKDVTQALKQIYKP
jgi:hypothetical protein